MKDHRSGLISDNGYAYYPSEEELRNIFAASCVEATASKLGCSAREMYDRMKAVDLFGQLIYPCYDSLHTQSREIVTEDILEALSVRENHKEASL